MNETRDTYLFIWFLGIEGLVTFIALFLAARRGEILNKYLQKTHYQFYKENLEVPFFAGGPDVMQKHYKALKIAYWGHMPDELSRVYQRKMKLYFIIFLICLAMIIVTIISAGLIGTRA